MNEETGDFSTSLYLYFSWMTQGIPLRFLTGLVPAGARNSNLLLLVFSLIFLEPIMDHFKYIKILLKVLECREFNDKNNNKYRMKEQQQ